MALLTVSHISREYFCITVMLFFNNQLNIDKKKLFRKAIVLYKKHIKLDRSKHIFKYELNLIFGHILQIFNDNIFI